MRKMITAGIITLCIIFIIISVVRTFTYPFARAEQTPGEFSPPDTSLLPVDRLAGGIQIPTISAGDVTGNGTEPFDHFKAYLSDSYPLIYQTMDTLTVNKYGLVYIWKGKNKDLNPVLFLSHYDVVPPEEPWKYPPFSGTEVDGRIYGRGTLDMKGMLFSLMEAADHLIKTGFVPERDFYFAFGNDEETGGKQGAAEIVKYFKEEGLWFDAVYDEGGLIFSKGSYGMINRDVAFIGVAEKGFLTMKIRVKGNPGHSSTPEVNDVMWQAATLIHRLEKNRMKARITPTLQSLFVNIGGTLDFFKRMAIANQWMTRPALLWVASRNPTFDALVRTTTAVTMIKGGDAENVTPSEVDIVANFRILPGNTVSDIKKHVESICRGFDTETEIISAREASKISSDTAKGFIIMKKAISRVFPGTVITPYISIVGTDSRKYEEVSRNIYRFLPVRINETGQKTIHGFNEYISIDNYRRMIAYFEEVMINFD